MRPIRTENFQKIFRYGGKFVRMNKPYARKFILSTRGRILGYFCEELSCGKLNKLQNDNKHNLKFSEIFPWCGKFPPQIGFRRE